MPDDLKAPERIWAWQEFAQGFPQGAGGWITHQTGGRTEYIRADRISTLEAALADMMQQRDKWEAAHDDLVAEIARLTSEVTQLRADDQVIVNEWIRDLAEQEKADG
jgi:molybdopterin converting factor small subunit